MLRTFIIVLALCGTLHAQKPLAVITGPSAGAVGDFLELDSSESVADFATWTVLPAELPDGRMAYRVYNDGRTLLIASVPGRYVVVLAVSNADGIDIRQHVVVVGGELPDKPVDPNPGPGPGPGPEPDKPPTFPDGEFKLAAACYGWAAPLKDHGTAKRLAANLRAVASRADAGGYADPQQLVDDTAQRNESSIPSADLDRWEPWFGALETELDRLGQAGSLRTLTNYSTAWRELAQGLEAVR